MTVMRLFPMLWMTVSATSSAAAQQSKAPARKPPSKAVAPSPAELRMKAVESSLLPSIRIKGRPLPTMTIAARMKKHAVPGVGIAVINDYELEWAKGYGASAAGVTIFHAAAASEPVLTVIALALVQAKKLDLDKDANKSLKKWRIPKSDYTKNRPVTLRTLLSHTSGLSRYIPGTPAGLDQALAIVKVEQFPGQEYREDGADYLVLEQLLVDVSKQTIADLAHETVFAPLGMTQSTIQPPIAAFGLSTTPADFARFIADIELAAVGKTGTVLRQDLAQAMITRTQYGQAGLGVMVNGKDSTLRFGRRGKGRSFDTEIVAFVGRGQGAVVMTSGSSAGSGRLIAEILNSAGKTYGWPDFVPPEKVVARMDPRVFDRYTGSYASGEKTVAIAKKGAKLFFGAGKDAVELLPESVSDFFTAEGDAIYSFVFDENSKVSAVTVKGRDGDVRWDRKG